jgi:hypothetical protein
VLSSGSLQGVLAGDIVTLNQSGHFVDKNAGLNKAVVASNSLAGADAANYAVNQPSYVTANISRATLSLSGLTAVDKVYNANIDAVVTGAPVAAALGSDNVSFNGTPAGQFSDKNVGVGKSVLLTGLSLDTTTGDGANYVMPSDIGMTASIGQRDLTISGTTVTTKVYDATTTASVSGGSLVGVQGADVLTLSQSGSFADKNAGTGKAVTMLDSISGAERANYNLIQPTQVTGTITPAPLVVSGLIADDKTYDGTTLASLSGMAIAMPLGSDQVTVSGVPSAVFASANAGLSVPVAISNLSLSGADAANYNVADITGVTANITPAMLSATVNAFTKVYDGNTHASPSLVLSGWVGQESNLGVQTFATLNSKNVTQANQLTVDSIVLSNGSHGELASNYQLAAGQTGVATITPAPLTATVTSPNKVYDGSTTATPSLTITAGLVGTEHINVSGTASFNAKDVLTANMVTVDSVSLSNGANGDLASNYSLTAGQTTAAQITPASLTASVTAPSKVYDGNTTATPSLTITAGLVGAEQINVSGTANFNSKNVLTANLVTVDSVSLSNGASGDLASNYSLAPGQTTAAQITPASLRVSDIAAASAVTGSFKPGAAVLVGVIGADKVTASVALDSPVESTPGFLKVGDYKQTVNTLTGDDASNYAVTPFTTALANYTVTALPVKPSLSQLPVSLAALTNLPAKGVAAERPNDSRTTPVISSTSSLGVAASKPNTVLKTNQSVPAQTTSASPTAQGGTQMPGNRPATIISKPDVLLASLKQGAPRSPSPTASSPMLVEAPSLVAGFTEQDVDFTLPLPTPQTTPDEMANTPTAWTNNTADSEPLDWEGQMYAGIREVLQSPVTYQVLTGASSVAFLVKTLVPSLLPTLPVPGGVPSSPPVRLPTSPGSMVSGRTSLGRWLGRA